MAAPHLLSLDIQHRFPTDSLSGEGWMRDLAEYGASLLVVMAALALSYWLVLAFVR